MERQHKLDYLINAALVAVAAAGIWLAVTFLLPRLLPFVLGVGVAFVIHPLARRLILRLHMRPRLAAVLATFAVYALAAVVIWVVVALLYYQTSEFIARLPELYETQLAPLADRLNGLTLSLLDRLSPQASDQFSRLISGVRPAAEDYVRSMSGTALTWLGEKVRGLPLFSLAVMFTIMTSAIVAWDYNRVAAFLTRQLPPKARDAFCDSKSFLLASLLRMLRAYLIIMLITFGELAFGLWLLRVEYWGALAALTAAVDILPVLGSGAVLISWAVVELLGGNTLLGVGLLVLWGVISLVRNIIEPKIVGDQIGLHPLVTITAMYFGLRTAGFLGLILAPLVVLLAVHLHREGYIRLYR